MTLAEILIALGLFIVAVWWAWTANFDACDKCDYDCNQGRDCPYRMQRDKK